MALIERLSLQAKLALLLALPLLVVITVTAFSLRQDVHTVRRLDALNHLAQVSGAVNDLAYDLQSERGATVLLAERRSPGSSRQLTAKYEQTDASRATFEAALDSLSAGSRNDIAPFVTEVQHHLQILNEHRHRDNAGPRAGVTSALGEFDFYSDLIGDLLQITVGLTELGQDRELTAQALTHTSLVREEEAVARERGLLTAILSGTLDPDRLRAASIAAGAAIGAQGVLAQDFQRVASDDHRQLRAGMMSDRAVLQAVAMRDAILDPLTVEPPPGPDQWFDATSARIDLMHGLGAQLAADYVETAAVLALQAKTRLLLHATGALLLFGVCILGSLAVLRSVTGPVTHLAEAAKRLALGDLSPALNVRSTDSLGDLATAFDQLIAHERAIVRTATAVGNGNLEVEVVPRSEQDELGHALQHMVVRLNESVRAFEQTAATAQELAAQEREARIAARRAADEDSLTGCLSRSAFLTRVNDATLGAAAREGSFHVLFVDLDRFKQVNDAHGHAIGDALLSSVARRLRDCTRAEDTVARLGGDEFAVMMQSASDAVASAVADRIVAELGRPHALNGATVSVAPSVGISAFPRDGRDAEALLRSADLAMYRVKQNGGSGWLFHSSEMTREFASHARTADTLRDAMDHGALEMHFQPIVHLPSRRIQGAEALLRYPGNSSNIQGLIDAAEESGLIVPLGTWSIEQSIRTAAEWDRESVTQGLDLAVNLSPAHIHQANVHDFILNVLEREQFPAQRLVVELTEAALIRDVQRVSGQLRDLQRAGVRIAIDDFGAGHASLTYLDWLPADIIKIDREFIAGLPDTRTSVAIVKAAASLAEDLGCTLIAEGVETAAQQAFLESVGCAFAQGFLYSPALPKEAWTRALFDRVAATARREDRGQFDSAERAA